MAADQEDGGGVRVRRLARRRPRRAAAVDHARRAEQQQQGQGVDDGKARSWRGNCRRAPVMAANSTAPTAAAGGDGQQVADAGEAPVLQGQPERQAGEQQRHGAQREEPQRRATGRGRVGDPARHRHRCRESTPSRATLTAIRISERAAAMPPL